MRTRPVARLILLLALVAAIAACGGEAPAPSGSPPAGGSPSLVNTAWIVRSVNDLQPIPGAVPTITFSDDAVTGTGGCNHLGGRYQYDASSRQIAIRELGATAMGCLQPGVGDYETLFLHALGSANEAGVDRAGQLNLRGPGGWIVLVTLEHPDQGG